MGRLLKCEDLILQFIKSHPDVTIVVEYDAGYERYVIGLHSESGGKFRKSKFTVKSSIEEDVDKVVLYSLNRAYHEVAIEDRPAAPVV